MAEMERALLPTLKMYASDAAASAVASVQREMTSSLAADLARAEVTHNQRVDASVQLLRTGHEESLARLRRELVGQLDAEAAERSRAESQMRDDTLRTTDKHRVYIKKLLAKTQALEEATASVQASIGIGGPSAAYDGSTDGVHTPASNSTPIASRARGAHGGGGGGSRRISATPAAVSPLPGGPQLALLPDHDTHIAAVVDRALGDVAMMFTTRADDDAAGNDAALADGRFGSSRLAHELRHMVASRSHVALQRAEDALAVAESARGDVRSHRQKLDSLQDAFASATADAEDRARSSASQLGSELARLRADLTERTGSIDHAVGELRHSAAKAAKDVSRSQSQLADALARIDDVDSSASAAHRDAKRATAAAAAATDAIDDLRGSASARIAAVERVSTSFGAEFEAYRSAAAESASQQQAKAESAAKAAKKAMARLEEIKDDVAALQGRVAHSEKALTVAAERSANATASAEADLSAVERRVSAAQQQLQSDVAQLREDADGAANRTEKLMLARVAARNGDVGDAIDAAEQRMRDEVDRKLSASSNRISSVVDELTDELRALRTSRSAYPSANQSHEEGDAAMAGSGNGGGQGVMPHVIALESELRLVIQELQLRVDRRTTKLSSEVEELSESCSSLQRSVERLLRERKPEPSPAAAAAAPTADEIAATVADEVEKALARRVSVLIQSSSPPADAFTRGLHTAIDTATASHADELRHEFTKKLNDSSWRARESVPIAPAVADSASEAKRQMRDEMEDLLRDAKDDLQATTAQHLQALSDTMASAALPPTPSPTASSGGSKREGKALELALSQLLTSPPPSVRNAMIAEMRRVAEAQPGLPGAQTAPTSEDLVAEVCANETLAAAVSAAASAALAGEISDLVDAVTRDGADKHGSQPESPLETAVTRIVEALLSERVSELQQASRAAAESAAADISAGQDAVMETAEAAKTMADANSDELTRVAEALDGVAQQQRSHLADVPSLIHAAMDELKAAHTDDQRKQAAAVRDVNRDLLATKEELATAVTAEIRAAVAALRHEAVEHDTAWSAALVAVKRRVTQLERVVTPVFGAFSRRQRSAGSRSLPNGSTTTAPGDAVNGGGQRLRPDDSPTLRSPNQPVGSPQHGGRAAPFGPAGAHTPELAERRWPPTGTVTTTTAAPAPAGATSLGLHDTDDGSDAQTNTGREESDGDVAATAAPATADDATADHVHGDSIHIARWPAVFTEGLRRVAAEVAREQIVLDKSNNNNTNNNAGSGTSQLQLNSPTGGSGRFTGAVDESAAAAIAREECEKAMNELRLEFRDDVSAVGADADRRDARLRDDLGAEVDELSTKLQGILDETTLHFRMRLDHFASKDDLAQHRTDVDTSVKQVSQQCTDLVENTRATLMRRLTASVPGGTAVYGSAAAVAASTAASSRSASADAGGAATAAQRSAGQLLGYPVAREVEF
jgi:hypothetical protein